MTELNEFRFLNPGWLLLLPPAWWLAWLYAQGSAHRSMWRSLCDAKLLAAMRVDPAGGRRSNRLMYALVAILTLAILAAAGPSWRQQPSAGLEAASARVVVIELSRAMLVRDVEPDRLSQALSAAREIISADFSGETGLVVYAGAAFVVSPLSRDANTLLAFLDALEPGVMPVDGSRIDLGIERARDLLLSAPDENGQILLIGTGVDDPDEAVGAALEAAGDGHQVSMLAIGTASGGPVVGGDGSLLRDELGNYVLAKTPFSALDRIAAAGNGILLQLTRATEYDALLGSRILAGGLVESGSDFEARKLPAANEGYWLVWITLPFALLLFRRNLIWVLLIGIGLPPGEGVRADSFDQLWQHREKIAYQAWQAGEFSSAGQISRNPLMQGAALYREGDYAEAAEVFTRDDSALGHYNRGNALARLERFGDAVEAYTRALEIDPGLVDARYNRRLLELFIEQDKLTATADPDDAEEGDLPGDAQSQADGEGRVGVLGENSLNPADQASVEPGLGASLQSGAASRTEEFDPFDPEPDRFAMRDEIEAQRAQTLVEHWIDNLPLSSTELFQRKFLRDHQRQNRQDR